MLLYLLHYLYSMQQVRNRILYCFLITDTIALDQVIKYLFTKGGAGSFSIIPNVLSLEVVQNTGVAFSLPTNPLVPIILAALVSIALTYHVFRQTTTHILEIIGLALIVGGSISNLIDRLAYGSVIDMIKLHGFFTCNIADIALSIGVALLVIKLFIVREEMV